MAMTDQQVRRYTVDEYGSLGGCIIAERDDLKREVVELRGRILAYEEADTSQLPYEKGWQDGRDDSWKAFESQLNAQHAQLTTLRQQYSDGLEAWKVNNAWHAARIAQLEGASKDAARYRWFRDNCDGSEWDWLEDADAEGRDAIIDAALAKRDKDQP